MAQGLYDRAEPLHERALALRETSLGKSHPAVAASLNSLAVLRLAQQRPGAAVEFLTRALTVSEQRLRREALGFSAERMAGFLQYLRIQEERLYALLRAHPGDASVRRLALSAALLLKGRSAEETAGISRAVYNSLGPQEHGTFQHLRELYTRLAQLSLQGPGAFAPAEYQRQLQALTAQGEALEAGLARRSAPLRALTSLPSPADIVERVAQALPADGVLIELITYQDRPLLPGPGRPGARPRYLALVLFPDATTRALDLGPAEPIDSAALGLRHALASRSVTFQPASQSLYALAFQPLRPLLGGRRHVFLSPDGPLSFVPFAALHDGHQFLVDGFDFTYLTSGRDLLPRPQEPAPEDSVVVIADPDFSAPVPLAAVPLPVERSPSLVLEGQAQRALAPVGLPGTRLEAESIQRLIPQARLFLGSEATRELLLGLRPPHPPPGHPWLLPGGCFRGARLDPCGRPVRGPGRGLAALTPAVPPAALRTPARGSRRPSSGRQPHRAWA